MTTLKILAVDDEQIVHRIVEATLSVDSRFDLSTASDGVEALEQVRRGKPDVVLLDVDLPGMDGFQVCRAIKADPSTASALVVMVTAMAQTADRRAGVAAGADDYLPKPFSPAVLLQKLNEIAARLEADAA